MDKNALFKINYGLYVLTANAVDEDINNNIFSVSDNGCIINTVMQLSSNPCFIGIAVNKQNYTHNMISKNKKFNISVLTTDAKFDIFKHFGYQSGKNVNKFADFKNVKRSANGLYYITENTNAYYSAYVKQEIDLESHTLFIGQLVASEALSDVPSVSYEYYLKNIKPKPQMQESKKTGWRCKICGYIYEGEELPKDYICPICKHGAEDFEKI